MSTAGKVLVVLVMLTSLVWIVLSAGVSQLNTNGNKRLHDLAEQVDQASGRCQASSRRLRCHARSNRDCSGRSRPSSSPCSGPVSPTLKRPGLISAKTCLETNTRSSSSRKRSVAPRKLFRHRNDEEQADQEALAKARAEVKDLMAKTGELTNQLGALRNEFQTNVSLQHRVSRNDTVIRPVSVVLGPLLVDKATGAKAPALFAVSTTTTSHHTLRTFDHGPRAPDQR